jgi:sulfhydrogenase subunit beta (sulfur reductase)
MIAILPKENLIPFLARLSEKMEVITPVDEAGEPVFLTWKGQALSLEKSPLIPPIEFLLPQREVLFRYIQESGSYTFEETPQGTRLIFGMRPCDLCAVAILDRIFGSEPKDGAYFGKRRWTILVALNCTRPGEGCFCSQLGSGPEAVDGFDLLLTELEEDYLAEIGSPAGMLILKDCSDLLEEADDSHLSEKRRLLEGAKVSLDSQAGGQSRSLRQMRQAIKDADWEALGRLCFSCGGCTFVCPICHCFNILDLGVPDGERVRCRDTCILSGFSRMAGGANPRRSPGERMRNWYLDKFEYIPKKTGLAGCVGCGRCSRTCLAEIDRFKLEEKR